VLVAEGVKVALGVFEAVGLDVGVLVEVGLLEGVGLGVGVLVAVSVDDTVAVGVAVAVPIALVPTEMAKIWNPPGVVALGRVMEATALPGVSGTLASNKYMLMVWRAPSWRLR